MVTHMCVDGDACIVCILYPSLYINVSHIYTNISLDILELELPELPQSLEPRHAKFALRLTKYDKFAFPAYNIRLIRIPTYKIRQTRLSPASTGYKIVLRAGKI